MTSPSLAHFVWLGHPLAGAHPAARQSRFRGSLRRGPAARAVVYGCLWRND